MNELVTLRIGPSTSITYSGVQCRTTKDGGGQDEIDIDLLTRAVETINHIRRTARKDQP